MREGQALRQLNHPNIVGVVAAIEEEGQHYLVMEYVQGGSLRARAGLRRALAALKKALGEGWLDVDRESEHESIT